MARLSDEESGAILFARDLLRWLAKEDPDPRHFLDGLGAVFATYCVDAKLDPVETLRTVMGKPVMESIR